MQVRHRSDQSHSNTPSVTQNHDNHKQTEKNIDSRQDKTSVETLAIATQTTQKNPLQRKTS